MGNNRKSIDRANSLSMTIEKNQVGFADGLTETILNLISKVPTSSEVSSSAPDSRARQLARNAARKSAGISGGK